MVEEILLNFVRKLYTEVIHRDLYSAFVVNFSILLSYVFVNFQRNRYSYAYYRLMINNNNNNNTNIYKTHNVIIKI